MDPIISGALQQQQELTAMRVQMSVMQKSRDVQKDVGEMLVGLIEQAAPQTMQSPAKIAGLGDNFDAFA